MRKQPFASPEEALKHYGVKGMHWGVITEDDTSGQTRKSPQPGSPEFQQMVERLTRTDHPQVLQTPKSPGGAEEKKGLSGKQKMLLTFGAITAAGAGYYAYQHYLGNTNATAIAEQFTKEDKLWEQIGGPDAIPKKWDVSGLKHGPISKQRLGDLAGGEFEAKLHDAENLVINTSRGYADILPKDGFSNPYAVKQHASVTRVLEEMRDKYPAVRNMNIEVVPMSKVPGVEGNNAHMCVMAMRAGEARVMYNDLMDEPTLSTIAANKKFLPGLGKKDYVAYHEMGHLLAVAHGELPASFDILTGNAGPQAMRRWQTLEPLLHRRMFQKHGFTFQELSKLSGYAATEPAEAMAELAGHYFQPEMRKQLTPRQLRQAEAMINEMGGLT